METKKRLLNSLLRLDKVSLKPFTKCNKALVLFAASALCLLPSPDLLSAASGREAAIVSLQQKIIDNPKDVDSHLKLAIEYSLSNNFVKAVETYFAILRIDPDNFHAYNNLGILYKQAGQFRDSLHCYQQAQRIDPDSCWVPYNMGLCYEAMGRMQEARESYGQALSLNSSFSQALQRLRFLSSDENEQIMSALPSLSESQIYVADSNTSRPVIKSKETEYKRPVLVAKASSEIAEKKKDNALDKAKPGTSNKANKKEKKAVFKYRTSRKGPAAVVFNQAMDALESGKMELAIELYANSVIAERDLLAEPENGIIRQGLTFLRDRPNRMANGLFFRGLLIYISGHLDLAVADMKNFVEVNGKGGKSSAISLYLEEAKKVIERYEAEKAARAALESERALKGTMASETIELVAVEEVVRPNDFELRRMSSEQIIQEADKLSRETRLNDAIAVLESGLKRDPDNVELMAKSANVYTDMLLLKGDNEAGKMALNRYKKVLNMAQPNSREASIAKEMISELSQRVR